MKYFAVCILSVILLFDTSLAQAKFRPPLVHKKSDMLKSEQQPISPKLANEPGSSDASGNALAVSGSSIALSDSIELPIPDSIIIPLIDFNNQPIQDVLKMLSAQYGINMFVDPALKAKITLRFTNISLRKAIKFIIKENGYVFNVKNGIIHVTEPPPSPPQKEPEQLLKVTGNLLTVDLKNADLDSVIRWIVERTGRNIIPEKGLKATLTAFFSNMEIDKGLKVLFETNGLELSQKDGTMYLFPLGGGFNQQTPEKSSRVKHFITVKDSLISFHVNNASISDIIREIATQANLQIYMYNEISGSITARVKKVTIDDAFENLLRNTTSTYWLSRNIYFFADKSAYEKKVFDLIPINYLQVDDIISMLPATITSKATVKKVKEYNAMLVEATTSDVIEQVRQFTVLIDKPIAQILIEAWVVEIKIDKLRKYGLKLFSKTEKSASAAKEYYPAFSGEYDRGAVVHFLEKFLNVSSNVTSAIPENFTAMIDVLENEGISNLISRPQIATLNGHAANITFGTTQFFTLEKEVIVPGNNGNVVQKVQERERIDVNMTLSVTPWVSSNNEVTMEISPTFDVPGNSPGFNLPPPINRRSLNSKVRVKNGEMIILGGLIGQSENQYIDKVPFLGDIPLMEWIFSTRKIEKSKTQLMIYLIPHVYYGSEKSIDPASIDLKKLEIKTDIPKKKKRRRLFRRKKSTEKNYKVPGSQISFNLRLTELV
jgi:type II secretory pathway component GspD/PulD (secretin)